MQNNYKVTQQNYVETEKLQKKKKHYKDTKQLQNNYKQIVFNYNNYTGTSCKRWDISMQKGYCYRSILAFSEWSIRQYCF